MGEGKLSPSPKEVSSMTVGPISGQTPISAGSGHLHTRVARWAVWVAEAAAAMTVIAFATYGAAYAVGGSGATEDNWVGVLVVTTFFAGLLASALAFAMAVAVKVRRQRWTLLWLPLSVFPTLLAFVILGEAFWWE